jgi:hypothetical protein
MDDCLYYTQTRTTPPRKRTMNATDKNAAISRMILTKVAEGMTLAAAIDAVLGAGRYDSIVSDVYETLRK